MTKTEYRRAHSMRRAFSRFSKEAFAFGDGVGLAGDILARSVLNWFQVEYAPQATAALATVAHAPMGRVLNWREAYLLHGRDRALLAHYRNRRWFRNQPATAAIVA
jgi:hypothetical protein